MTINPTVAKDIALEWLALLGQRPTPPLMARLIKQVKGLMEVGFTDEEIRYAMDYIVSIKPDVYSFGYVESSINDVLRKRKEEEQRKKELLIKQEVEKQILSNISITKESEVAIGDETSERNQRKAERLGIQSRKREKSYFHLFER